MQEISARGLAIFVLATVVPAGAAWGDRAGLTFEQRLEAQRAIESVRYEQRIWPADNPPRPSFESAVRDSALCTEIENYLQQSNALASYFKQPLTAEALQAELDRMAASTRAPLVLSQLFKALGNDPELIAETLVRPVLVDRVLRDAYAGDSRFSAGGSGFDSWWARERESFPAAIEIEPGNYVLPLPLGEESCDADTWRTIAPVSSSFPYARASAVWTGAEMIVWGGTLGSMGRRYDPATDSWLPTATAGAPPATQEHTAVWTGSKMIVWGGFNSGHEYTVSWGGVYDPASNKWTATAKVFFGLGRAGHTAVWTGTKMLVFGGHYTDKIDEFFYFESEELGRYDPETNTWTWSPGPPGLASRAWHNAVWTGTEMIMWGGHREPFGGPFVYLGDGARYDPATGVWTPLPQGGAPSPRSRHTAVWTGDEMIVWGGGTASGASGSGGRFGLASNSWMPTALAAAPQPRAFHKATWTGSEMVVWGGSDYNEAIQAWVHLGDGARYNPFTDAWTPTSAINAPSITGGSPWGPAGPSAAWTGTEMIIWGGYAGAPGPTTGRAYCAATEIDSDNDLVLDGQDCAPLAASVWAAPGPARNLIASASDWSWMPPTSPGSAALTYDVLRSTFVDDFSNPACLLEDMSVTTVAADALVPAAGSPLFYLIRAENDCASNLGTSSAGEPHLGGRCP